jgi:hypothetical protein
MWAWRGRQTKARRQYGGGLDLKRLRVGTDQCGLALSAHSASGADISFG